MDYFEHFGIPRSFLPNLAHVRQQYLAISRNNHPDLDLATSDEEKERITAFNNAAYSTLTQEDKLFHYLLDLHGLKLSDLPLSSDFLMEMMELNEEIEELVSSGNETNKATMQDRLLSMKIELRAQLQDALTEYDLGNVTTITLEVANYCLKINYLNRLISNLKGQIEL